MNLKGRIADNAWRDKAYRYLFQAMLIVYIPLWLQATNAFIILSLLFWLTEPGLVTNIKTAFKSPLFLIVISVFLFHVVSLIWTTDTHEGWKQLEIRISLLVFPLILGTIRLSQESVIVLLKTFIWVCFGTSLVGLGYSVYQYIQTGETVYLYSDNLVALFDGQAIYFALYLNVAILFIIHLSVQQRLGWWKRVHLFVVAPVFLLMIFLLASRMSLIILVMLAFILVVVVIVRLKNFKLGAFISAGLLVGALAMALLFPKTVNRFKSLAYFHFDYQDTREVYHFNEEVSSGRWNGMTIRLAIWSCAWNGVLANPLLGSGIGDYMESLDQQYQQKGFKLGLIHQYSPHNQYLQILVSTGTFGLILFILSIVLPARYAYQQGRYVLLFFLLLVGLNMLTEDVLGAFRGVVFFSFLDSLLLFQEAREIKVIEGLPS